MQEKKSNSARNQPTAKPTTERPHGALCQRGPMASGNPKLGILALLRDISPEFQQYEQHPAHAARNPGFEALLHHEAQHSWPEQAQASLQYLWNTWDPLGVVAYGAENEYQPYINPMAAMPANTSTLQLQTYLKACLTHMGLPANSLNHNAGQRFYQGIRAWHKRLKQRGPNAR